MAKAYVRNSANDGWIEIGGGVQIFQGDSAPASTYPGMLWLDTDATAAIDTIADADGDTKVQCEESADEDIIRMDCAGTEVWKMSAAGERTMVKQPAFQGQGTTSQTNLAHNTTIVFGTEVFDQGADFASSTFTAPITGRYRLEVQVTMNLQAYTAAYNCIAIVTSNRTYYNYIDSFLQYNIADYYTFTLSILADMDASDTALVKYYQSGGSSANDTVANVQRFSGNLVC